MRFNGSGHLPLFDGGNEPPPPAKKLTPAPGDDRSLDAAKMWLHQRLNEGARCPCCDQHAQVYWRTLNSGMAIGAIRLWRWHQKNGNDQYAHLPSVIGRRSAEEAKLRYWNLIEEATVKREDGGRAGYWRLTADGQRWVSGQIALPKYVQVFDGKALGPPHSISRSGRMMDPMTIQDALGKKFNYEAMMNGEA